MLVIAEHLNTTVNDFDAKISTRYNHVFVVTKLVKSGTQCWRTKCIHSFQLVSNGARRRYVSVFPVPVSGFSERLQKEVSLIAPPGVNPKVIYASPQFGTWIGGSILVSLPQMADMFVTKDEYAKQGATILHKKCL